LLFLSSLGMSLAVSFARPSFYLPFPTHRFFLASLARFTGDCGCREAMGCHCRRPASAHGAAALRHLRGGGPRFTPFASR
jgi:hypothetical protein